MEPILVGLSGLAGSGKDTTADELVKSHRFVKVALADILKRICKDVYAFTDEQLWGPSSMRNGQDHRYPRKCKRCGGDGKKEAKEPIFPDQTCPQCEGSGTDYLTPREALQTLGTEWGRHRYDNTWIDMVIRISREVLGPCGDHSYYNAKTGLTRCSCESDDRYSTHPNGYTPPGGVAIPDVRFKNEMSAIRAAGGFLIRIKRGAAGLSGPFSLHPSEAEQLEVPDEYFDHVAVNDGPLEELPGKVERMLAKLKVEGPRAKEDTAWTRLLEG